MISILDVIAVKLPQVFTAEILPKLDMKDTLNLAQVNKAYNAAVWSADGVRSLEAKIKTHFVKIGKKNWTILPLYWATKHGNVPAVRACLESGVDVNKVQVLILTKDIRTALHIAAELGHAAVVKALIEAGADVNKPSSPHDMDARGKSTGVLHNITYNKTPVYTAAAMGHTHVVMELIMAGADVNQATSKDVTSLYVAAQNGHEACVVSLIQAGADIHKAANNGWTPLAAAVYQKHKKVVAMLKHFGRA
jgi:cytohesin